LWLNKSFQERFKVVGNPITQKKLSKYKSSLIVNHTSTIVISPSVAVISPSVVRQSLIKDCYSQGCHHLHAPHMFISTGCRVQLSKVTYLRCDVLAPISKQGVSMRNLSWGPALSGIRLLPPLLLEEGCIILPRATPSHQGISLG